jgi:hypothetical protein
MTIIVECQQLDLCSCALFCFRLIADIVVDFVRYNSFFQYIMRVKKLIDCTFSEMPLHIAAVISEYVIPHDVMKTGTNGNRPRSAGIIAFHSCGNKVSYKSK